MRFAALAGSYGLDPMRVLGQREPLEQAISQAVVVCADELRQEHDRELAVQIINQLAEAIK
ncbi:MAG TPA: hypothetical protein VMS11_05450 [Solirubrobacterales bacterium]|nr:hypothetical protein [Solirubrobacterales bacterium]